MLLHLDKAAAIQIFLLTNVPDLTDEEKKNTAREHIKMMMENSDYLTAINNLTGNWWDLDQNNYMEAKKIQMEIYLQANPFGIIDCGQLSSLPLMTYQDIATFQPSASVLGRIDDIRSQNIPAYTTSNFKVRPVSNALGPVVNCDYFFVKINSLPYINNVQLTADEFLEYFRTHLNDFVGAGLSVSFEPYVHFVAGSVNVNETTKWNSTYESSLGGMVHIDMANDGTVVESGYSRNFATQHHSFTFTTMYTPLDENHPVSGNRRFGIFNSGGAYYFYISGIDRTNDAVTTIVNFANIAFNGADDLWHSVQDGIIDFCDTHQGDAVWKDERVARPLVLGPFTDFLRGKLTIQQLKDALNCP